MNVLKLRPFFFFLDFTLSLLDIYYGSLKGFLFLALVCCFFAKETRPESLMAACLQRLPHIEFWSLFIGMLD